MEQRRTGGLLTSVEKREGEVEVLVRFLGKGEHLFCWNFKKEKVSSF